MRRPAAAMLLLAVLSPVHAAAQAADRWAAHASEAWAMLPASRDGTRIKGATLRCAGQLWTLTLPAESDAAIGDAPVMTVDGNDFALAASGQDALSLRVPGAAIEPLKNGLRMRMVLEAAPVDETGGAVFSLRGSRVAIDAAEERCSRRDMSAYRTVTFTPYSSYINLTRELREDDIRAFAQATASQPQLTAAMVELDEGRRLLFTRLCGSSWYYGRSGCNITGFAPDGDAGEDKPRWRAVYDTENVLLYLDPDVRSHGWPDVVTLPMRGQGGLVWRWNGSGYALKGELSEPDVARQLRPGLD